MPYFHYLRFDCCFLLSRNTFLFIRFYRLFRLFCPITTTTSMHYTPPTLEMNSKHENHTHAAAEYNCEVETEKKKIEFESSLAGRQKSVMKSALGFAKRGVKASSECQILI